jgi:hypothetical protein
MKMKKICIFDWIDVGIEILKLLDSQSIANLRLTCPTMKKWIDDWWNTKTGRKYLDGLIKINVLYKEPHLITKPVSGYHLFLKWDKKDIFFCTTDGKVKCFNTDNLNLRWETEQFFETHFMNTNFTINEYAIFIVDTRTRNRNIAVLGRSSGLCLYKIDNINLAWPICIRVWKNRLAAYNVDNCLKFYNIEFSATKVLQCTQSESKYRIEKFDNYEEDVISNTSRIGELVLWNFQTGKEVKSLATSRQHVIIDFIIKKPYVVVLCHPGINIFNYELGTMIRDIAVPYVTAIHLTNMWLMICLEDEDDDDIDEDAIDESALDESALDESALDESSLHEDALDKGASVELFYWPDLIQEEVALDQVAKRVIELDFLHEVTGGIDGTRVITAEGNSIVVRNFWQ